jgi:hypothetical protein
VSRERARRRAEREAAAAVLAKQRAAAAEKKARSAARKEALVGWVPKPRKGPSGIIAERKRRQLAGTVTFLVAVNVLTFAFSPNWGLRLFVLLASLVCAPVVHMMLHKKGY